MLMYITKYMYGQIYMLFIIRYVCYVERTYNDFWYLRWDIIWRYQHVLQGNWGDEWLWDGGDSGENGTEVQIVNERKDKRNENMEAKLEEKEGRAKLKVKEGRRFNGLKMACKFDGNP